MIDADKYERIFLNNLSAVLQAAADFITPSCQDTQGCLLNVTALPSWSMAMLSFRVPGQSETHSGEGRETVAASCLPFSFPFRSSEMFPVAAELPGMVLTRPLS